MFLSCFHGGYPSNCHTELRISLLTSWVKFATMLAQNHHNSQSLTNIWFTQQQTRRCMTWCCSWEFPGTSNWQHAFFDVRVFKLTLSRQVIAPPPRLNTIAGMRWRRKRLMTREYKTNWTWIIFISRLQEACLFNCRKKRQETLQHEKLLTVVLSHHMLAMDLGLHDTTLLITQLMETPLTLPAQSAWCKPGHLYFTISFSALWISSSIFFGILYNLVLICIVFQRKKKKRGKDSQPCRSCDNTRICITATRTSVV